LETSLAWWRDWGRSVRLMTRVVRTRVCMLYQASTRPALWRTRQRVDMQMKSRGLCGPAISTMALVRSPIHLEDCKSACLDVIASNMGLQRLRLRSRRVRTRPRGVADDRDSSRFDRDRRVVTPLFARIASDFSLCLCRLLHRISSSLTACLPEPHAWCTFLRF